MKKIHLYLAFIFCTIVPFTGCYPTGYKRINENEISNYVSNANGIPMSGYFFGNQWVQVKDSSKGAMYAKECKKCSYYDTCYEGVFSPLLSVSEILHISGCMNNKLYYQLEGKSEEEIRQSFEEILNVFESTELRSK